jgi:hypothetical protein
MKRILLFTAAMILLSISFTYSASTVVRSYFINTDNATVAWDEVTNTDLSGFRIYTQPVGSIIVTKTEVVGADKRKFVWVSFPSGHFLAWITAYDKYGNESEPSETIQVNKSNTKPTSPTGTSIVGATIVINMP